MRAHLDQLLTPSITRVELERSVSASDGDDVSSGGLSDSRRSRDEDGSMSSSSVLSRLLEVALVGSRPEEEEGKVASSQ